MMNYIGLCISAYLIGSIPFGLIIAKLKKVDLRQMGSGNIGATNVCRNIGWQYGVITLFLDALKGYIATLLALNMVENPWIHVGVGLGSIIGHSLSFLARFKGGKGVATTLGVLMALSPDVCIIIAVIGVVIITITRYVAPVTILCSIAVPLLLYIRHYPMAYISVMSMVALFIVIRHRSNIKRIFNGTENQI
jgi:glycerol-3-phosphate acyltransferase PlsY